jgi:hypothetical protein
MTSESLAGSRIWKETALSFGSLSKMTKFEAGGLHADGVARLA